MWPRRLPCASRYRTIWCAVTTMGIFWNSFGMPRASNTTRLELGEDFVSVLTELGGGGARLPRRAVKVRRRGHHRCTPVAVRHVDDATCRVKLLVGDDVLDGVDRRPEEIRFCGKDFRPFVERLGSEDLVEHYADLDGVGFAGE